MSRCVSLCLSLVVVAAAACGGKVVFVAESSASSSGAGGASSAFWIPTTAAGCTLEPPEGLVQSCEGATTGSGNTCGTKLCDAKGNNLVVSCLGTSCSCSWNGMTPCVCDEPGVDFCDGATPSCCH